MAEASWGGGGGNAPGGALTQPGPRPRVPGFPTVGRLGPTSCSTLDFPSLMDVLLWPPPVGPAHRVVEDRRVSEARSESVVLYGGGEANQRYSTAVPRGATD